VCVFSTSVCPAAEREEEGRGGTIPVTPLFLLFPQDLEGVRGTAEGQPCTPLASIRDQHGRRRGGKGGGAPNGWRRTCTLHPGEGGKKKAHLSRRGFINLTTSPGLYFSCHSGWVGEWGRGGEGRKKGGVSIGRYPLPLSCHAYPVGVGGRKKERGLAQHLSLRHAASRSLGRFPRKGEKKKTRKRESPRKKALTPGGLRPTLAVICRISHRDPGKKKGERDGLRPNDVQVPLHRPQQTSREEKERKGEGERWQYPSSRLLPFLVVLLRKKEGALANAASPRDRPRSVSAAIRVPKKKEKNRSEVSRLPCNACTRCRLKRGGKRTHPLSSPSSA